MNRRQKGFSLIELLIVVTIILIISAIAIPNLMKSKQQANETAAVGALKALTESAVMYSNSYGGFPRSIANLGPSSGALTTSSAAADLIDSGLATGVKSGYKFTFTVITADTAGHVVSYSITAVPVSPGSTGVRSFYTFIQPADRLTPLSKLARPIEEAPTPSSLYSVVEIRLRAIGPYEFERFTWNAATCNQPTPDSRLTIQYVVDHGKLWRPPIVG